MLVAFIWHQGIQFSALPLSSLDIHSEWKSWWGAPPEASKRSKHGGSICRVVGKIKELFGLENLSPSLLLLLLYVCSRTFTYTLCPSVHKRPEPKRVVSLGWMTLDDASRRRRQIGAAALPRTRVDATHDILYSKATLRLCPFFKALKFSLRL